VAATALCDHHALVAEISGLGFALFIEIKGHGDSGLSTRPRAQHQDSLDAELSLGQNLKCIVRGPLVQAFPILGEDVSPPLRFNIGGFLDPVRFSCACLLTWLSSSGSERSASRPVVRQQLCGGGGQGDLGAPAGRQKAESPDESAGRPIGTYNCAGPVSSIPAPNRNMRRARRLLAGGKAWVRRSRRHRGFFLISFFCLLPSSFFPVLFLMRPFAFFTFLSMSLPSSPSVVLPSLPCFLVVILWMLVAPFPPPQIVLSL